MVSGWLLVSVSNVFSEQLLPQTVVRTLSSVEKAAYAAPFPTVRSRPAVRQWPREIPIDGKPVDAGRGIHFIQEDCPHEIGEAVASWLERL